MLQNVGFSHFAHPKRETFAKRILKFQQALSHIDVKKAKVLEAPRHIVFDCAKPKTFAKSKRIFQEAPHHIEFFYPKMLVFALGTRGDFCTTFHHFVAKIAFSCGGCALRHPR